MREVIGELLIIAGLLVLLAAAIAGIVALYQLARRRIDNATRAGATVVVLVVVGIVGAYSGGRILLATEEAATDAPGDAAQETPKKTPKESKNQDAVEPVPEDPVLTADDVITKLESRGLYCTSLSDDLTRCEEGDPTPESHGYMVMVSPGEQGSVKSIQAIVYGYTSSDASFLGDIAALKIREDLDTEATREWVMGHADDAVTSPSSEKFGGLAYSIEGGGETRILTVTEAWY